MGTETTFFADNMAELTKTLNFVRRKLKNETAEQRKEGLANLVSVPESLNAYFKVY